MCLHVNKCMCFTMDGLWCVCVCEREREREGGERERERKRERDCTVASLWHCSQL